MNYCSEFFFFFFPLAMYYAPKTATAIQKKRGEKKELNTTKDTKTMGCLAGCILHYHVALQAKYLINCIDCS